MRRTWLAPALLSVAAVAIVYADKPKPDTAAPISVSQNAALTALDVRLKRIEDFTAFAIGSLPVYIALRDAVAALEREAKEPKNAARASELVAAAKIVDSRMRSYEAGAKSESAKTGKPWPPP